MRRLALVFSLGLLPTTSSATPLTCAENSVTFQMMCFANNGVTQNGDVRAAKLWMGGPKNIERSSITARVHCISKGLELTDSDGVAFARNRPGEQVGKDLVRFLCEHKQTKKDPKLSTK